MKTPEKRQSIWGTLLLLLGLTGSTTSYNLQESLKARVDAGIATQADAHDVAAEIRKRAQAALGSPDSTSQS